MRNLTQAKSIFIPFTLAPEIEDKEGTIADLETAMSDDTEYSVFCHTGHFNSRLDGVSAFVRDSGELVGKGIVEVVLSDYFHRTIKVSSQGNFSLQTGNELEAQICLVDDKLVLIFVDKVQVTATETWVNIQEYVTLAFPRLLPTPRHPTLAGSVEESRLFHAGKVVGRYLATPWASSHCEKLPESFVHDFVNVFVVSREFLLEHFPTAVQARQPLGSKYPLYFQSTLKYFVRQLTAKKIVETSEGSFEEEFVHCDFELMGYGGEQIALETPRCVNVANCVLDNRRNRATEFFRSIADGTGRKLAPIPTNAPEANKFNEMLANSHGEGIFQLASEKPEPFPPRSKF